MRPDSDWTLRTVSAFRPFEPLKIAGGSLVLTLLVALLWFSMSQRFNVWETLLVLGVSLIYYVVRFLIGRSRLKALLEAQKEDAFRRFPRLSGFVPIGDDRMGRILPKNAALGYSEGQFGLVTFKQPLFALTPQDAIFVPGGPDFSIDSVQPGRKNTRHVHATLMQTPLEFAVVDDPELISLFPTSVSPLREKVE